MSRQSRFDVRRVSFRPQIERLESRNLLSFGPSTNFPVDANPLGVALADLNSDGNLDVVTANYGAGSVSVLLGNGNGTFQSVKSFAAGAFASTIAVGDFNGDHLPDLAVGHFDRSATTVSVLLGNGDGTFQAAVDYTVGSSPIWVIAADLNGDSILDLVAANNDSANISVLLGNSDGTFQAAQSTAVGSDPIGLAAADLNGDKIPDLVVANSGPDTVSILFGNGDGTFQASVDYPVGRNTSDATVGDFNGDGAPDLAITGMGSGDVTILLNDGQGGFQAGATYPVSASPIGAVVGDFNSDGKLDLVVGYYDFTQTNVTTLLGNGDGTFQTSVDYAADIGPVGVVVGDVNGDTAPDLVVANASSSDVSVLLNLNDWGGLPPVPPGGGGRPRAEQPPVVGLGNTGTDSSRPTEPVFQLPRNNENGMIEGEPDMTSRTPARGSDEFRPDENLYVDRLFVADFLQDDGIVESCSGRFGK